MGWFLYALGGLVFGVLDWYFLDGLRLLGQSMSSSSQVVQILVMLVMVAFNYGVWLIPSVPASLFETRCSSSTFLSALAAIVLWCMALVSYYTFFLYQLMFVGLPNLGFMLYSNRQSPTYWSDWQPLFERLILHQLLEWLPVAVIGGSVVGVICARWYKRKPKNHGVVSVQKPVED